MQTHELMLLILRGIWALFIFAYGACVGSLINVIVYRMPRGISIVTPPSRCPSCNTRLSWRDNIPVLGWVLLRGRCRYCGARVSAEYPTVEASVGLLFMVFYLLWYAVPQGTMLLGIDWGRIRPEWFLRNDASVTWPTFVLLLTLLGSLVAMTIVDARTYTIPLILTWVPAALALLVHPLHSLWIEMRWAYMPRTTPGYLWAIPTPDSSGWGWAGAALGAMVGLGISNVLLWLRLIRPSFADYAEWEKSVLETKSVPGETSTIELAGAPDPVIVGGSVQSGATTPVQAVAEGSAAPDQTEQPGAEMWIQYPHARREVLKELAFLAPAALLALGGWYAGLWFGGVQFDPWQGVAVASTPMPLWLTVLTGVLMGYLIGGGIVWFVRIMGSLGFGREAMGLGDVHLMGAVGACLGWIDAVLAFFGAAFVGIAWAILGRFCSGGFQRAMPYGPFMAVATVLVLLTKPAIEAGLSMLLGHTVNIP